MKEHFINLLLEEYKLDCLFEQAELKDYQHYQVSINNRDIVFDMIGFPKDNSDNYAYDDPLDDMYFCRDWMCIEWPGVTGLASEAPKISITNNGLQFENQTDELAVRVKMSFYIDWLYEEFEKYSRGDYK